ncbi:cellulase family glycosylhydrolase [Mycolicibacterium canariasense]|uniref:cellulase family glycosylhydrolase n=1 Tax=Mycolicibacterium canariasense TaxID=228230 RepID=UPI0013F4CD9D|nr:cellulase family glycosylhydrolase [Mycolicibacterium canariasense]MCV7211627.1 cellulase family glycosylhydrolase [Mycolicibacterium canariasense]
MTAALMGAAAPTAPAPTALRQASHDVALAAAIDTSSDAVGIAESQLYFMTPEEVDTALDTMQSLGVTQFRMFVPWRAVEPAPGVYDWTNVDKVIDAAEARGMAVLAAVTSTPTWASDNQTSAYGAPNDPADFGTFMGALASRYGAGTGDPDTARISAYEIWNEPQSSVFWNPKPDPAAYTELLKAAYTAIKAVDPSGTVVGGVVTAGRTIGDINISPVEFVQDMYAAGAAGYFDALSYHPYNYDWKFGDGVGNPISAEGQLQAMRNLMDANGDAAKLIWTSEYGLPTSYVSEAQQADFIGDFMDTWSDLDGVGPMFIYSLVDQNSNSTEVEDTWGLFRDDWTPKQAAAVVRNWIADHGGQIPDAAPADPVAAPVTPVPTTPATDPVQSWADSVAAAWASWTASVQQALNPGTTTTASTATTATPTLRMAPAETATAAAETAVATTQPTAASAETSPVTADSLRAPLIAATQAGPEHAAAQQESSGPTAASQPEPTRETPASPATPARPATPTRATPATPATPASTARDRSSTRSQQRDSAHRPSDHRDRATSDRSAGTGSNDHGPQRKRAAAQS